jgi:hypothetical protein
MFFNSHHHHWRRSCTITVLTALCWLLTTTYIDAWSPTVLMSRRSAVWTAAAAALTVVVVVPPPAAFAAVSAVAVPDDVTIIPMITMDQFINTVIRDSASSIRSIEFSGPQSETVRIILQDDSVFGISDVIESPTDPRSPLKLVAVAKANGIPVRFVNLESIVVRNKAVYANERVQAAFVKEQEKAQRMQADEEWRLLEVARMKEAETASVGGRQK